jgi:hypothetical protein
MLTSVKRLVQDVKQIIAAFNTGATALGAAFIANYPLTKAGLKITTGGAAATARSEALTYSIAGVQYSLTAQAALSCGTDVVPSGKYGAIAFDVGTDGTVDTIVAPANATGYASAAAAVAALPAPATGHARLGTITATKSNGAFTFGTTNLDAASTTVAYTDGTTLFAAVGASMTASIPGGLVQKSY